MKKNNESAIPVEQLAEHPLVHASKELTESLSKQRNHLKESYTYLAENPANRSHDSEFQYEIQAMKLAAKEIKESNKQISKQLQWQMN